MVLGILRMLAPFNIVFKALFFATVSRVVISKSFRDSLIFWKCKMYAFKNTDIFRSNPPTANHYRYQIRWFPIKWSMSRIFSLHSFHVKQLQCMIIDYIENAAMDHVVRRGRGVSHLTLHYSNLIFASWYKTCWVYYLNF